MQFGFCYIPDYYPDLHGEFRDWYERLLSEWAWADELGYDSVWIAEHRYPGYAFSSTPVVLQAMADRTSQIRIGTAVALNHPAAPRAERRALGRGRRALRRAAQLRHRPRHLGVRLRDRRRALGGVARALRGGVGGDPPALDRGRGGAQRQVLVVRRAHAAPAPAAAADAADLRLRAGVAGDLPLGRAQRLPPAGRALPARLQRAATRLPRDLPRGARRGRARPPAPSRSSGRTT